MRVVVVLRHVAACMQLQMLVATWPSARTGRAVVCAQDVSHGRMRPLRPSQRRWSRHAGLLPLLPWQRLRQALPCEEVVVAVGIRGMPWDGQPAKATYRMPRAPRLLARGRRRRWVHQTTAVATQGWLRRILWPPEMQRRKWQSPGPCPWPPGMGRRMGGLEQLEVRMQVLQVAAVTGSRR